MNPDDTFDALMRRLEKGDGEAAAIVYDRYARRLIALAQQRLAAGLRSRVGADDVVQSAFRTFFRRVADRQFDLAGEDALWALLATITIRKCSRCQEQFSTQKRGGAQPDLPLQEVGPDEGPADKREPSPADAVILIDLVEELLRGLDARERQICEMRLQGYTVVEIAGQLDCTLTAVYRKLDLIKRRLQRLTPPEDSITPEPPGNPSE
jgi:RNA polymerase sigma-70 factor (ECF subfamily)